MTGFIVGAVIISFSSIMVRLADVPPDVAGFYRLTGGGLGMAVILWRLGKLRQMTPHVWRWSLVSAVFFAADFYCWHRAIGLVGPGLATMLANFQVIALAAVSVLFLRERVSRPFLLAIPMALTGLYLMVGVSWASFTPEFRLGVVYGLLTALFYALYLLALKFSLSRAGVDALAMAGAVALITGLMLGGLALGRGDSFAIPDTRSLAALAALALVCHAVGWYLITRGIQQVRTSLVGLILLLQPTLSYVWDILFFDKATSPVELTGVALALAAIYLGSLKKQG
ncbi:EamA family transporter [Pseudodesulfovibrio sp. F-1]|uniref:EamA family transporter n=1 Tax=Pseudodesulfovibrio alkaliphilus TaxID=2661613 RepID=A0A7K1KNM9_9BACT|nr:DMT family transporter [Pseudodesulfovibrio alkaliphilus]MUM77491.1 EamA family transporter [Pseudodesulfovibrio alkaliphilus]